MKSIYVSALLLVLIAVPSCTKDEVEPEVYWADLSSSGSDWKYQNSVITAYYSAFRTLNLNHNVSTGRFPKGTSLNKILEACNIADKAILSSSVKFPEKYSFSVRKYNRDGELLFYRAYGTESDHSQQ